MGTTKMATYVAERSLLLFFLLAFVVPAKALKCHSCLGNEKECKLKEVTCPASNYTCGSSTTVIKSFPLKESTVFKGCVTSTVPHRKVSMSPSLIVKMSFEEKTCNTDLCNKETIPESEESNENTRNCYSCISNGNDCTSENMRNLKCRGQQTTCLDIRVIGNFGEISDTHFKGCGEVNCSNTLTFSNSKSTVLVKCCNDNFCNGYAEFKAPDKIPNGVQCISCDTLNDQPCSSSNFTTTECFGDQTSCYEAAGLKIKNGKPTPAVLKGCASPNICDNSMLQILQNLKGTRVQCCNGNTCNNNFNKDNLQASDFYFGTGTKSDSIMYQAPSHEQYGVKRPMKFYNPVKTGHAFNNYGPVATSVLTSNNYATKNNNGMDYGEVNTLSFAVIDVPTLSPMTHGGHHNNFNYGSWNNDNNGDDSNPTSASSDVLFGSNLGSIGDADKSTKTPPTTVNDTVQNQTSDYAGNSYTNVESGTNNDFLLVGSYIESETDYITENGNNISTTSEGPTQSPGTLNINSHGGEPNVTSLSADGLNSGLLSTKIPQTTINNNVQNQTLGYNSDIYIDGGVGTNNSNHNNDFLLGGSLVEREIDHTTEGYNNLTTTSEVPTQSPASWGMDNNGSEPTTSGGLTSAPSGPLSTEIPQSTVNGSVNEQNLTSANNSDLYSPTDEEVFVVGSETDTYYTVETVNNDSNLTTTSQGPTQTGVFGGINSELNSDSFATSNSDQTSQILQETTYDDILQQDQTQFYNSGVIISVETITKGDDNDTTGNYSAGVDNSLSRAPQDPNRNSTQYQLNNSNIGIVPYILNSSSGGYGANIANKNNPNKPSSHYNCSSFAANAFSNPGSEPRVNNNGSNNGTNSSTSNLILPSTGESYYGSSSSNENGTSNGSNPLSTGNVHSYGNGNDWGNSSDHNLSMMPPGGYNGSSGLSDGGYSHIGPNHSNSTSGSGYLDNSNTKPNSTENVPYLGSGTSRSNSSSNTNGFSNLMPSVANINGSNNETNSGNSNLIVPSTGGSYYESSSSNHSTLDSNRNLTSDGSNSMSSGNFHSYGDGNDSGNSSDHNLSMMPPGGYNGSSGFSDSGYSYVGPNHPNSTSGSGYLDNSSANPNATENVPYLGSATSRSNSSTNTNGFSNLMPSETNNNESNNGFNTSSSNLSMTGGSFNGSSSSYHSTLGSNENGSFVETSNSSNPLFTGNVHSDRNGSDSSNPSVHNPHMLPPGGYNGSSDYNSNGSYTGTIFAESMPAGSVHSDGNGSDSSNSSVHNPHMVPPGGYDSNSTPNVIVGGGPVIPNVMPPDENNYYGTGGNSYNNYYIPMEEGSYGNHNGPGSPYSNYDPNMLPPEVNGPPMVYFNGNDNNYSIFQPDENPSSHRESIENANNAGSSYPNMPPSGNYSNLGNIMPNINGSNSYQLPPGLNWSTNGNLSNFINVLSNATGVSPTVLSERLHGKDLSNPGTLASLLSGLPGFDYNRLPPELKAMVGNTHSNSPGFNYNMPHPHWNISSFGGGDKVITALSAAAGISPDLLTEKLTGVDINDPSKVASVLSGIPSFDSNLLPPEMKAALYGHSYSNNPGFNYNMPPPHWNISSFGGRDKVITALSAAAGISPDLLTQKLNGVDINDPSKVASVLSGIHGFDSNRLPPEMKAALYGKSYSNIPGVNYNMPPPRWDISSFGGRDRFINTLSTAAGISPDLLTQKLKGVDLNDPRKVAAVLFSIPSFDVNRLPSEMKAGFASYTSNAQPNTTGYNHNGMHLPNWNISNLVNDSHFLEAVSNMTNISVDVLSQKFKDINKDGQSNMTALLLSLPGFDPHRLPLEYQKDLFGNGTNTNNSNMMHPGSNVHAGNALGNGTTDIDLSLSDKNTNNTASDDSNLTYYSGTHSLRGNAGVLAIIFTIILLC